KHLSLIYSCCDTVTKVQSYEGYSESVSCPYESQNSLKYICRGNRPSTLINKYGIHDDKTARIFTATISDLHSVDAGQYWCGVTRTGSDIYTEFLSSILFSSSLLFNSSQTAYLSDLIYHVIVQCCRICWIFCYKK
uniref:Immunoglobulin V-set domain-containing protein n=1 Tax=Pundamilia nyererei TaxID=303518 RepID=A0A3B4H021_9CICH